MFRNQLGSQNFSCLIRCPLQQAPINSSHENAAKRFRSEAPKITGSLTGNN
jgi:hypothetical protein